MSDDSDDDYVASGSTTPEAVERQPRGTRSIRAQPLSAADGFRGGGDANTNGNGTRRKAAWEDIQKSWEQVVEGADGSINQVVEGLRQAGKRRR